MCIWMTLINKPDNLEIMPDILYSKQAYPEKQVQYTTKYYLEKVYRLYIYFSHN